MSYTWQNGEVITAEKLNNNCKIQFINMSQNIETQNYYLDKNWQQIKSVYDDGGIVFIKYTEEATNILNIQIGYILNIFYNEEIYGISIQINNGSYTFEANAPIEQLTFIDDTQAQ